MSRVGLALAAAALAACVSPEAIPCGDGWCAAGEACVDGMCVSGSLCGDELVEGDEECDEGAANSDLAGATCRKDCTHAGCGDEIRDPVEQCDSGDERSDVDPDACRLSCSTPRCGDGVIDGVEAHGCFEAPVPRAQLVGGVAELTADLDGDGHADLVTIDEQTVLRAWVGPLGGQPASASLPVGGALALGGLLSAGDTDGVPGDELYVQLAQPERLLPVRWYGGQLVAGPALPLAELETLVGVADVDGDGAADLITHRFAPMFGDPAALAVRRSLGAGDFAAPVERLVDGQDLLHLVAHVDGDEHADVLRFDSGANQVLIFAGQPDGGLAAPETIPVAGGFGVLFPAQAAVADFNGDGLVDLALAKNDEVVVMVQAAGGGWVSHATIDLDVLVHALLPADAGGDGRHELVVLAFEGRAIWVSPAQGEVGFGLETDTLQHGHIVDLERDGFPDLAVSSLSAGVQTLRGGDGVLGRVRRDPALLADESFAQAVAGDFDGDGRDDLALLGEPGLMLFAGARGEPPTQLALTGFPDGVRWAVAVDLDGDGRDELAWSAVGLTVEVARWDGGGFAEIGSIAQPASMFPAFGHVAADPDGDGRQDVLVVNEAGVHPIRMTPMGALELGPTVARGAGPPPSVGDAVAGDVDGDGDDDLVVSADLGGWLYEGTPAGLVARAHDASFTRGKELLVGRFAPAAGDPGRDLLWISKQEVVHVRWRPGHGLVRGASMPAPGFPSLPHVVDLNRDGVDDVLLSLGEDLGLEAWLGRGDGSFAVAAQPVRDYVEWLWVVRGAGGVVDQVVALTHTELFTVGAVFETLGVR